MSRCYNDVHTGWKPGACVILDDLGVIEHVNQSNGRLFLMLQLLDMRLMQIRHISRRSNNE